MKRKLINLRPRYQASLRKHLKGPREGNTESARALGAQALAGGLHTLDLAKLHEEILITEVLPGYPPGKRAAIIKNAGFFFAAAITPLENSYGSARQAARLKKIIEALSQRTVELAASNLELSLEILQRKAVEEKLKKSEHHYTQLLKQSDLLQEQLRRLSRQILSAQEDERKKISRELHDVIAQTLTGINVRLATLKRDALLSTKGLERSIAHTQRLVEQSVGIVHQFARELRPAVLDDLGLIPALHSFMKNFTTRTGVRTRLTVFAGIEQVDTAKRTVLYRIAQEALTNVAQHARASQAEIRIERRASAVEMTIKDDGDGFFVESLSKGKKSQRLGMLGMRERAEMVNGHFRVDAAPGKGTTIEVRIPSEPTRNGRAPRAQLVKK
jgi:signal transduction histidine kinase